MLDLMRQANRRRWFVWIIIMFVVVSFVLAIFAIWGGAATRGSSALGRADWVARVNGHEITVREFDRRRQQVEGQYRQALGDAFDQQAANINFDQVALAQLLGQTLIYSEAERLGFKATDTEVTDAIVNSPIFHRGGVFIGRDEYENEMRARGYDVAEYEDQIAREITNDKLRTLMGTMVGVNDAEIDAAFIEEGETAEVDYVLLKSADFPSAGEPSEKEIESWYREHRSSYLTPEKRRALAVLIDRKPLQSAAEISDAEITEFYEKNKDTRYDAPEQRRASHILFKTAGGASADDEAIRAKAEAVLAQARGGADFADLARQNSGDSSASAGGDLGWFGKGRMVPEFEQAAFALSEGQVSDLVRTQFGLHIIKLIGSRPAGLRPLAEVSEQIKQELSFGKAQELLKSKAEEFSAKLAQQASSFEGTAGELGYQVVDTGFIAKGEPLGSLGALPQAAEEIFRLKPTEYSGAITSSEGAVFVQTTEVKATEPSPLPAVKDRVKEDLVKARAAERARATARELTAAGAEGFKAAADKKKLEVKSTGTFTRASAPPEFNDEIKKTIFSRRAGELLGPLDAADGVVVIRLIKHGPETAEETALAKARLKNDLLRRKQEEAFDALMRRLQRAASIEQNEAFLSRLTRRASR